MSDFVDRLQSMSQRIVDQAQDIRTEEGTTHALIAPFIKDVLGFDTSNVREVRPEYIADIGIKTREKVDYAILIEGQARILIEAKKVGYPLEEDHPSQLHRYFGAVTSAKFGIFTNGIRYLFYTDLDIQNVMDTSPFFQLDFAQPLGPVEIAEIKQFTKLSFNEKGILESASRLKYTQGLKRQLEHELSAPTDDFIRHMMQHVYAGGKKTRKAVEEFRPYMQSAIDQYLADTGRQRLIDTMTGQIERIESTNPNSGDRVITTSDELRAYFSIKAILHSAVDTSRLTLRDRRTVCLILLDDNGHKAICRLYFDDNNYRLRIPDGSNNELTFNIDHVDDIFDYAEQLRASVHRLL